MWSIDSMTYRCASVPHLCARWLRCCSCASFCRWRHSAVPVAATPWTPMHGARRRSSAARTQRHIRTGAKPHLRTQADPSRTKRPLPLVWMPARDHLSRTPRMPLQMPDRCSPEMPATRDATSVRAATCAQAAAPTTPRASRAASRMQTAPLRRRVSGCSASAVRAHRCAAADVVRQLTVSRRQVPPLRRTLWRPPHRRVMTTAAPRLNTSQRCADGRAILMGQQNQTPTCICPWRESRGRMHRASRQLNRAFIEAVAPPCTP